MTLYGTDYAEVYDLVMRHRGRDHAGESAALARLVRARCPGATSLLDIACGTGLHLEHLRREFDQVTGVDVAAEMLALAGARVPGLRTCRADMRHVALPATFDAVVCLFAVPHLRSTAELDRTVARLARHLAPGGVLVVEPWYAPGQFVPGYLARDVVEAEGRVVVRLSHSTLLDGEPHRIRMVVHHVDARTVEGIRHATETVDLTLFTPDEFASAFARAGCPAEHVRVEPFRWGLWVAGPPPAGPA